MTKMFITFMLVQDSSIDSITVLRSWARHSFFRADLHGTTLLHVTSLQQAYNVNCFVYM